jgi:flagellar biosynthesis/type III secretory pathway protein FliH
MKTWKQFWKLASEMGMLEENNQKFLQEGMQKGIQKGRQEGRQEILALLDEETKRKLQLA